MAAASPLQDSLEELKSRVTPEQAAELDLVVQFDIAGKPGGTWHALVRGGDFQLSEGPASAPTVTLQMASQDWFDMVAGKKVSQMLFMTGKLKVKGDMMLAVRLASLLRI
jgi:putative sterol carrier protein